MVLRAKDETAVVGGAGVVAAGLFADSVDGLVEQVASFSLEALIGVDVGVVVHVGATHTASVKATVVEGGGTIAGIQFKAIIGLGTERLGSSGGEASISGLFAKEDWVSIDINQVVWCCSVHYLGSCSREIMVNGMKRRTYRCVIEARLVVLVADRLGLDFSVVFAPVEKSLFTLQVVLVNIMAASYNIVVLRSGMIHHEQSCQWRNSSDALLLKFWFWFLVRLNRTIHTREQSRLV